MYPKQPDSFLPSATPPTVPTIIGLGTFGKPLSRYLERHLQPDESEYPNHLDKERTRDREADGTLDNVAIRVIQDNPSHILLAITPDKQATEGVEIVKRWLSETPFDHGLLKIAIQINSVQSTVRQALKEGISEIVTQSPVAVISLHPYHGIDNFADNEKGTPDKPKTWILTGIDIFNPDNNQTDQLIDPSSAAFDYIDTLASRLKDITLVDLTDGQKLEDGQQLNGSEYHDMIAAYYQAVFHMVRLTPNIEDSNWYKQNFAHVKASFELSTAIITDNPFALVVADRYKQLLGTDYSVEHVLKVANTIIKEGEQQIPHEHRTLKTANVAKLQKIYTQHVNDETDPLA